MVDIEVFAQIENIVRTRLQKNRVEILRSMEYIASGNPLASETNPQRRIDRIQQKTGMPRQAVELIAEAIDVEAARKAKPGGEAAGAEAAPKPAGPEAIRGSSIDFVGVAFLERGRRVADAVGRVAFLNGRPQGSGFLVAPGLFLTNHHVIETREHAARFQVEFDYESEWDSSLRSPSAFDLDPDACFVTDGIDGLDYTLIAVGKRRREGRRLDDFGFIPLSVARDKHMLGEVANVIQHPDGRFKEVVLRENRLVGRDETQHVLHYVADTEQGSSGSPVFNNEWEAIALHHWAGPWRETMGSDGQPLQREINEGIRVSAIVDDLTAKLADLRGSAARAVSGALQLWETMPRAPAESAARKRDPQGEASDPREKPAPIRPDVTTGARSNADGSITWTFPIEISVRAPLASPDRIAPVAEPRMRPVSGVLAEAASWKTEDFSDRGGYEPGFIPGFVLPLPALDGAPGRPAVNMEATGDDDPHELRYHHFSIALNAERRLAFYTACNIDGARVKAVNRDTKTVTDNPSLADLGVESLGFEGAEASDDFRPDRRIAPEEQMTREFYESQKVPGFPDPQSKERIARMFQKGHIIMRGDPAWGIDTEALAAERDTFFYTNAAPQLGFFNQGSALNKPGSKGKLRWRAVETYVLRNAVTTRSRISVFAGPIFAESDPVYRFGSKVPMRFWKIVAWADNGELRSIALLADQKPLLQVMPEAIGAGAENFVDEAELERVSEFLSTVEEIQDLTGLDFGQALREADVRAGSEAKRPLQDLDPDGLRAAKPRSRARPKQEPVRSRRPRRKG